MTQLFTQLSDEATDESRLIELVSVCMHVSVCAGVCVSVSVCMRMCVKYSYV